MTWLVLDVNPERWAVGPLGVAKRGGKLIPTMGRNQQLDSYKDAVREAVGKQSMLTGKVKVTFYFWRNMAEYQTHQSRTARNHEADATNMQKATEDALQGIFYSNDKDNSDVRSVIVEQGPGVIPRIVIHIEPWLGLNPDEIPQHIWCEIDGTPDLFSTPKKEKQGNGWQASEESIF